MEMQTPEGANAAPEQSQGAAGGVVEGLDMLKNGVKSLAQGLQQAQAPQEALQLAGQALSALDQLSQMMGGEQPAQEPPSA